ncbi:MULTISPECIES: glucose-6-phosphate dehydrogenase assembly protein OpcA [Gordonia]|uniref:Glucose-6-phosphate dehydrogenase assembly protein OpcA n=1 Tax=Gordonia hongkongensis TaxID=1701090 RepID=A0ABT6BR95_9ACTN|nr:MULTISPECIES: glucose-6-phosphate dehydrogenase assembly protein OpcA [Gordonia]MBN0972118.1 glucose-6-phosphate dehydrogenase assembly protein OpcA [Gordonia sp. BP-119]MBN0982731.1 glucose-6-phosphate dehydrogenase assembly protein OpcA [Gordonia sp. BP-94]MDF6100499.1 glucose-6-phosphate dehydrogenase assembly protein OpcA [Gordonia hongkongensis]
MIVELPDTSTGKVAKKIIEVRAAGGALSLGRVLTLVVCVELGEPMEGAIEAAVGASREHPSRVIVVYRGVREGDSRLDAQIRVGGDAGASEVVVLSLQGELADHPDSVVTPFLLPDTPVVTWWPGKGPRRPADDPLGKLGHRRIVDASKAGDSLAVLAQRLETYSPGDTDLAWTHITHWRAILASAVDRPPHTPITEVVVTGSQNSPSVDLIAGWLRSTLNVPTRRRRGSFEIRLHRDDGPTILAVDEENNAVLTMPGKPDGRVAMGRRELPACIAEELRRLDTDEVYIEALKGVPEVEFTDDTEGVAAR